MPLSKIVGWAALRILCRQIKKMSVISQLGSRRYQISEIQVARPGFEPGLLAPQAKGLKPLDFRCTICAILIGFFFNLTEKLENHTHFDS